MNIWRGRLADLKLNPIGVCTAGRWRARLSLHKIAEIVVRWTFLGIFRWRRQEPSQSTGFLSRSRWRFRSVFFLSPNSNYSSGIYRDPISHRYFHIYFDGFSFFEAQIQLSSRFRLLLFNCFSILHVFEVILKSHVEVKWIWAVLQEQKCYHRNKNNKQYEHILRSQCR